MSTTPHALSAAADSFYLDRQAARLSPYTLAWYHHHIDTLIDWLVAQDVVSVESVTADMLRHWLLVLAGRNLAERTLHHYASAAKAFFNFCEAEGFVTISPMHRLRMPRLPEAIPPAFSEDDVRRLLKACDCDRDTAIVLCLLDTGCRLAEFAALTLADVDMRTGSVSIRRGKGGKGRTVYLGAKARRALNKYVNTAGITGPLWLCDDGAAPLSQRGMQRMLWRVGQRAGVQHCHPHTFRRTFALWSLRAGMDIYSLQRIMGHSNLTVLRRYLAITDDDAANAHRQHGAVDSVL